MDRLNLGQVFLTSAREAWTRRKELPEAMNVTCLLLYNSMRNTLNYLLQKNGVKVTGTTSIIFLAGKVKDAGVRCKVVEDLIDKGKAYTDWGFESIDDDKFDVSEQEISDTMDLCAALVNYARTGEVDESKDIIPEPYKGLSEEDLWAHIKDAYKKK